MKSFAIGPFAFSITAATLAGTLAISSFFGNRIARRQGVGFAPAFWCVVVVAVGFARAWFVAAHWREFVLAPWSALDFRDGGLDVAAGVVAGALVLVALGFIKPMLRKPLAASVLTAAATWILAASWLDLIDGATRVPAVELTDLRGNPVKLSALAGKPLVLNLWATWCPPCRKEMPLLYQAQQANPDITFAFADQGQSADEVNAFPRSEGLALRNVVLDQRAAVAAQVGSQGLPTTLFYDAAGKLVDERLGALSTASLAEKLEAMRTTGGQPR